MEQKQIYEKYVEEFTDEIKDYIKETKHDMWKGLDWKTILENVEAFRVDMLSILQEIK